ncbi:hypothetical protein [Pelagicoccus mobilis]|uniref:Uncharacterized protein n=1 Tax=Pelagicoccus mobilis TaxID=415221 RepID=A0A934S769_9BACT|nr:hypothetical protein [Pelagicoccus mobilis]MBK1880614.1 hypothetical protein [Pelagicoccus mobilis]
MLTKIEKSLTAFALICVSAITVLFALTDGAPDYLQGGEPVMIIVSIGVLSGFISTILFPINILRKKNGLWMIRILALLGFWATTLFMGNHA